MIVSLAIPVQRIIVVLPRYWRKNLETRDKWTKRLETLDICRARQDFVRKSISVERGFRSSGFRKKRGSRLRTMGTGTCRWGSFRRVALDQLIRQLSEV